MDKKPYRTEVSARPAIKGVVTRGGAMFWEPESRHGGEAGRRRLCGIH